MPLGEDVGGGDVVGAEAHPAGEGRVHLGDGPDVLRQEMGDAGLPDEHVHTLAHFLHHFLVVIALVVQPHPGAEIAV